MDYQQTETIELRKVKPEGDVSSRIRQFFYE